MKDRILKEIKAIEADYEVKVCYAVESGSRLWGFPSEKSDFDVRFIYVHQKDWYLSIDEKRDVIELPINHSLDINGWDIRKALKLFRKSNPPMFEWLQSDMVYYQAYSLVDKMRAIQNQIFLPQSALYHYIQMAKRNYKDHLQKDQIKIKRYFTILRPILACKWIEKNLSVPPVNFMKLLEELLEEGHLKQEIRMLVHRKISGDELKLHAQIPIINEYIESEIEKMEGFIHTLDGKRKEDMTVQLDRIFRATLEEVWSS